MLACSSSGQFESKSLETTIYSGSTSDEAIDEVTLVPVITDIAVGPNRFAFGILKDSNPLRIPEAAVRFVFLEVNPPELRIQSTARFVRWPVGNAGVYTVDVEFEQAGRWGVIVDLVTNENSKITAQVGFIVKQESASPGVGKRAIPSSNKTVGDIVDLSEITTSNAPDPELYFMTIEDAVSNGRPTLLAFATPGYCQTATCGPQIEVVSTLKNRYKDRANFIHIEVYDNPSEIQGDLSRGRLSPILLEWGLISEPFTFVIDKDGRVASKFEGFATESELEMALSRVLDF